MDIGDVQMQSSTPITFYITSLVEGNIELIQKIWYQTDAIQTPSQTTISPSNESSPIHYGANRPAPNKSAEKMNQRHTPNINIEYVDTAVKKSKEDTVIIPCVEEFKFTGKFYTLNKQALTKAFKNEEFLFRVDLEIRATCDIDILDMFLICVSKLWS